MNELLYKTPGERIKHLRIEKNWSVEMLAAEAGISPKQVRSFENNSDGPLDVALSIAVALEISPNKLMTGINEPREKVDISNW